jgi:hypothetical protein
VSGGESEVDIGREDAIYTVEEEGVIDMDSMLKNMLSDREPVAEDVKSHTTRKAQSSAKVIGSDIDSYPDG